VRMASNDGLPGTGAFASYRVKASRRDAACDARARIEHEQGRREMRGRCGASRKGSSARRAFAHSDISVYGFQTSRV
jgi:hypothetical protein